MVHSWPWNLKKKNLKCWVLGTRANLFLVTFYLKIGGKVIKPFNIYIYIYVYVIIMHKRKSPSFVSCWNYFSSFWFEFYIFISVVTFDTISADILHLRLIGQLCNSDICAVGMTRGYQQLQANSANSGSYFYAEKLSNTTVLFTFFPSDNCAIGSLWLVMLAIFLMQSSVLSDGAICGCFRLWYNSLFSIQRNLCRETEQCQFLSFSYVATLNLEHIFGRLVCIQ